MKGNAEAVVELLADTAARRIIELLDSEKTAQELATEADIPRSTVYRKVDQLAAVGLIDSRYRIQGDGAHPKAYRRAFGAIDIHMDGEDFSVEVEQVSLQGVAGSDVPPQEVVAGDETQ